MANYKSLIEKFLMFQEIKLTLQLYQVGDSYIGLYVILMNVGFNKIHIHVVSLPFALLLKKLLIFKLLDAYIQ